MRHSRLLRALVASVPAVLVLHTGTAAQAPPVPPISPNGISVSPAKVYDNRSLTIMLEQLEKQLQRIRVVDDQKDKLIAALAAYQGARVTEIARALSLTGSATPGVSTTEQPSEAGDLRITERTTTEAGVTPATPSTTGATSGLTMSPTFGVHAEDLLSDQVTLSYQIMNVRMLLERALSDRLIGGPKDRPARLQVVLGFQISIDPPKDAKDKVAFVELSVTAVKAENEADLGPVSLVSVMPYEKTYNAFAIDRRSNAFGGAAIAKIINLGYSERRGSESLYVYKDADTLAFGNPALGQESKTATFGWEFRPVLGRPSVTPGLRQMFAVFALPYLDDKTDAAARISVSARTYWRKYDRKRGTLDGGPVLKQEAELGSVDALTTGTIAEKLGPRIKDVQWRKTDDSMAILTVKGTSLFTGTQVIIGHTVHNAPENGLVFKSDQLLEVRTTMRELALGEGAVSGRYGDVVPLEAPFADYPAGIFINGVSFRNDPGRAFVPIDVVVQARDGTPLVRLPPEEPLLTVGTELATSLVAQPTTCTPVWTPAIATEGPVLSRELLVHVPAGTKGTPVDCWRITGTVRSDLLQKEPTVAIKYPFRGSRWRDTFPIYDPTAVTAVTRLGGAASKVRLAVTGRDITDRWRITLDQDYAPVSPVQANLALFEVDSKVLGTYKKVVVRPANGRPVIVDVSDAAPPAPSPTIDANQKKSVKKETAPAVTFTGAFLKGVKAARFDDKPLVIKASDDGKAITIYLTRAVTAKPGDVVILLETEGGVIQLDLGVVE